MSKIRTTSLYIFVILFFGKLFSQELPPIDKYPFEVYNGGNQNWTISQAENNFIYVANNDGLLEFNGAKWSLYPSPNNTIIRSVTVIGSKIYTGCYMEFGFWERNEFGFLKYTSLSKQLKNIIQHDEQFWKIINYDEWIIFQSLNNIYFYNTILNKYKKIHFDNVLTKVFEVGNTIYFHVLNEGIYIIKEGKPELVIKANLFENDWITNIFQENDGLLIVSQSNGFYRYANQKLSTWNIPSDYLIAETKIYSCIQLEDKSLILGTISKGLIHLNINGLMINQFNQINGLSNNTVLSLFEDNTKNIWAGLHNGINCININSPIKIYNDDKGNIGTVYTAKVFNQTLYIGTNQGLYYRNLNSTEPFNFINGTKGQVWNITTIDNSLFCGHDSGTFLIRNNQAKMISNIPGTWIFRQIPNKPDLIIQGNYDGLSMLQKINGEWQFRNKIKGFDISSRFLELDVNNNIWINHEYKGVYKLTSDKDFRKIETILIEPSITKGKNSSIVKFKDKILYAFQEGVFYFDVVENKFKKEENLSKIVENEPYTSGKLIVDELNNLWIFTKNNAYLVSSGQISEKPTINKIPIPTPFRKSMTGYENVTVTGPNKFLIGKVDGFLSVDISKIKQQQFKIHLNSVGLKSMDSIAKYINLNEKGEFKYKQNSFEFDFSVPKFEKHSTVDYLFKLEGFHANWIHLGETNKVNLDNLPYGNYTFKVKAIIGNELTLNEINYQFKINKPWFLSTLAWIVYFILLFTLTLIIHKSYKIYFNKKHLAVLEKKRKEVELSFMEKEQQMMQIKNDQLKYDIESKNRELAISTMSIIKKNEVLTNIKNELQKTKTDNSYKPVLRLIDKNLNDSDDWNFFEEAFNNADKNFMKKIKKIHASLTPNDLRLCAYLRLNLSSKEIANLLNISTRSVEIKRYRLRKKMGLAHDVSLVNYILEI